jgi:hypothetical protein
MDDLLDCVELPPREIAREVIVSPRSKPANCGSISTTRVLKGGDCVDADDSAGNRPGHRSLWLKTNSIQSRETPVHAHLRVANHPA